MPNFFERLRAGAQSVARGIAQVLGFGREEKPEPKPEPPPEIEQRERDVRSAYEKLRDKYQEDLPAEQFEGKPYIYEEEEEEVISVPLIPPDVLPDQLRPPLATYEAARRYQNDIPLPRAMTEIVRNSEGSYQVIVFYTVGRYHEMLERIDPEERRRISSLKRERKQTAKRRQRRQRSKTIKRITGAQTIKRIRNE